MSSSKKTSIRPDWAEEYTIPLVGGFWASKSSYNEKRHVAHVDGNTLFLPDSIVSELAHLYEITQRPDKAHPDAQMNVVWCDPPTAPYGVKRCAVHHRNGEVMNELADIAKRLSLWVEPIPPVVTVDVELSSDMTDEEIIAAARLALETA